MVLKSTFAASPVAAQLVKAADARGKLKSGSSSRDVLRARDGKLWQSELERETPAG